MPAWGTGALGGGIAYQTGTARRAVGLFTPATATTTRLFRLPVYTQPRPLTQVRTLLGTARAITSGTAIATWSGSAGAAGQLTSVAARAGAAQGHAGAHGQLTTASARAGTASGSTGAHGQVTTVAAHRTTFAGTAGAHTSTATVAAHTTTLAGHAGAAGTAALRAAHTTTWAGHAGAGGQATTTAGAPGPLVVTHADSSWGAPLAGEALWGESDAPSLPRTNPAPAYLTLVVSGGDNPPTLPEQLILTTPLGGPDGG